MAEQRNSSVTASDREIVISRVLNAQRALVFDVWTDPNHVGKWYGPRGITITTRTMDVRPGGTWKFVMHGPDRVNYQNKNGWQMTKASGIVWASEVPARQLRS